MKPFLLIGVCAIIAACKPRIPPPEFSGEMLVAAKPQAALRQEPSTASPVLAQLAYETRVKILAGQENVKHENSLLGVSGDWYRVECEGVRGWIYGPLLKRPSEKFVAVILQGQIFRDNPELRPDALTLDVIEAAKSGSVSIGITLEEPGFSCNGSVMLGPKSKITGDASCGGTMSQYTLTLNGWHLLNGQIQIWGAEKGSGVCHSESCEKSDLSFSREAIYRLELVKKSGDGNFEARISR